MGKVHTSPDAFVRILVVDDFGPSRVQVRSILAARPELRVIAEAADGLEAVRKAQELKPNLILLDLGLPSLDGVEAARRIRQVSPDAAMIFLTQNGDEDAVRAALRNGVHGYVLKTDAGSELLAAVAAVLDGGRFLSSGIRRHNS